MSRLAESPTAAASIGRIERTGLLVLVTLISLPHIAHLPPWVCLLAALLLSWQAIALWRGWRGNPPILNAS